MVIVCLTISGNKLILLGEQQNGCGSEDDVSSKPQLTKSSSSMVILSPVRYLRDQNQNVIVSSDVWK